MKNTYSAGVDIGSTTAKVVICDNSGNMIFSRYYRHKARTEAVALEILEEALKESGNIEVNLTVTGSAGMGLAETYNLPFLQEVVASARFIKDVYPDVRTFIEIGGEDSKIIFFDDHFRPDMRMNGSCAGGTGAFIDQMAVLLDVPVSEFNALAEKAVSIYPIASRCGVFAKTDIQALLSRDVSREDVAASVFHAVAIQVITALSRGHDIKSKTLFGGGPLSFYPELRRAFVKVLAIKNPNDLIIPDRPELIPAMGAALLHDDQQHPIKLKDLLVLSKTKYLTKTNKASKRLPPLFESRAEFESWQEKHLKNPVPRVALDQVKDKDLFLGIDSGSTTTKIVLADDRERFVIGHYRPNNGNPIQAVKDALSEFAKKFKKAGFQPRIIRTAATGYGEDLIKAAFGLDDGVVETMAHYRAARRFDNDVSFILDIGGQDMKAIYIRDHAVSDIQVNEACSSGCGSFLETFASSLGYSIADFAKIACEKNAPFDLGTRCTVFMNSKVKQALSEGATVADVSAGLAYSVIKNSIYKVLKLRDVEVLGNRIVAQGGTFRNPAVLRAFELLLNKEVVRPDIPALMGAYGAAITALNNHRLRPGESKRFTGLENASDLKIDFTKKEIECNGCENRCAVMKLTFANGNKFFTGNRCERHFSNSAGTKDRGSNLIAQKLQLLFDRQMEPERDPIITFGIPRCLNMYENFPFWSAFLTACGFKIVLSSPSNFKLFEKGASTVMSENICFPAKLAHGHIFNLLERKVDRIFYPIVVHEKKEYQDVLNSFNCPVVTGYPDVVKSAIDPKGKYKIPFDNPAFSFRDDELLKKQLYIFFRQFGIDYGTVAKGVKLGFAAQKKFKKNLMTTAASLINEAENKGRTVIVLAGRPYHIDPLINHGIPELLTSMGVDVITEDAVPMDKNQSLADVDVLTQWTYTNRLYAAAGWVGKNHRAELIHLISFGCGLDAVSADEVRDILKGYGKIYTSIKMDEISNLGAVRIRLRSMLEAVKENAGRSRCAKHREKKTTSVFVPKDRDRTLIAPYFSPFYSPLLPAAFRPLGYRLDVLPPQDKASVEYGLKNINNDMCYPAVLVAGDIIKAFQSGRYDPKKTSIILTQTGGQCRASSYVSLIRKGLTDAGLENVPIIAISNEDINPQPGFIIDKKELIKRMALGIIFTDPLTQMYLSTVVREDNRGDSKALHTRYLSEMETGIEKADYHYLLNLLKNAVTDFNSIKVSDQPVPRIGVVGEIFVKYNFFSNGNIIEWLSDQGVEVALPCLQNFFTQRFVNEDFDQKTFFKHSIVDSLKHKLLYIYTRYHLYQIERVMQQFRFYRKPFNLKDLAEITSEVVSLANRFGEGWLLTAEMIAMLNEGIGNIVCLQPFGCISNHITGRGMEKKLKEIFPHLNLLSLDMDAGASEVNILNRLHFIIIAAREEMKYKVEVTDRHATAWRFPSFRIWPRDTAIFDNYVSLEIEKAKAWVSGLNLWKKASDLIRK
ncbi:MAG: acyl-CoA dehydratase activase [Thermodesulfobacteriota bacterium]|nr:acyl-CoA dehydratase activase [Thermodesulfobacteriota bacterium]